MTSVELETAAARELLRQLGNEGVIVAGVKDSHLVYVKDLILAIEQEAADAAAKDGDRLDVLRDAFIAGFRAAEAKQDFEASLAKVESVMAADTSGMADAFRRPHP